MNKVSILEAAKNDMIYLLQETDLDHLEQTKDSLRNYFSFLEQMTELEDFSVPEESQAEKNESLEESDYINKTEVFESGEIEYEDTNTDVTVSEDTDSYLVERKIRGAYVPEIDGFIPEGVIRRIGIQHNDYVHAEKIDDNKYDYTIAAKGEGIEPEYRKQFNYCIVEFEAGNLVAKRTFENVDIRYNEVPFTIILNNEDIIKFKVAEGDIVDIAFPHDRPDKNKIIWKHITNWELNIPANHTSKESKKDLQTEDETNDKNDIDPTLLEGTSVLLIGNEPKKALYKEKIEQRGGIFLWADAKDNLTFLEAQVKKADKVIFLLKVSGHTGMKQIKALCKKYNKPFLTTFSIGQSTVLKMAEEKEEVINF